MEASDRIKFVAALTACAEYYGKDLSDAVIGLYWQGLQRFSLPAVLRALQIHMRDPDTGQFMPKIADVTRLSEGSTADCALIAWTKFDRAVRSVGPYQDVVFDDPIIHRVVMDMGGWQSFGLKKEDEWPFIAKEFQNRYRGFKQRDDVGEYLPVLGGIANAENAKLGRQDPPLLVGDAEKAKAVMVGGTNSKPMITRIGNLLPRLAEALDAA